MTKSWQSYFAWRLRQTTFIRLIDASSPACLCTYHPSELTLKLPEARARLSIIFSVPPRPNQER